MFVVGLSRLDPGSALIEQSLGYLAVGRNCSIKNLVFPWRVRELSGTLILPPTGCAQRVWLQHAKPMKLIAPFQTKPMQALSLLTTHASRTVERIGHVHVGAPFGNDRYLEALAQSTMNGKVDVSHVADNKVRREVQDLCAIVHAGLQK